MMQMIDRVAIHTKTNGKKGGFSESSYDLSATLPCRVMGNSKRESIKGVNGEEVTFQASIYVNGFLDISYSDRIEILDIPHLTGQQSIHAIEHKRSLGGAYILTKVVV